MSEFIAIQSDTRELAYELCDASKIESEIRIPQDIREAIIFLCRRNNMKLKDFYKIAISSHPNYTTRDAIISYVAHALYNIFTHSDFDAANLARNV